MAQMLSLKIDVTKIDKARLFTGAKGTYLDCVVFLKDEPDQYGNIGMITQSVSKEEREAGTKGAILGNARKIGVSQPANSTAVPAAGNSEFAEPSDLPF
jgi:hypothetical protein